ncbi:FAD-dependent oxidoreductase (plasmid) [Coraliomargarita sp. W4R53]
MTDVTVVGAGPVGMLLAAELNRRGAHVRLLERRLMAGQGTRAIGVHAPVLTALEASGITAQLLDSALRVKKGLARSGEHELGVVHFDRLSSRFPFVATLAQAETERVLAALAPQPERGARVTRVQVTDSGVRLKIAHEGGDVEDAASSLVVIAGGWAARSLAYREGRVPTTNYRDRYLMSDIVVAERDDAHTAVVNLAPSGVLESFPLPGSMRRVVVWNAAAAAVGDDAPARVELLRAAMRERGEESSAEAVIDATAFGVRRIVAPQMRRGRLFVIGDSAHEVSPIGGQGMNLGLLDAAGLAPLLARWIHQGRSPDTELSAWERRRVRSAVRAGRLAGVNTLLGRPRHGAADLARRTAVRAILRPPLGAGFAWAYSMGLDAGP